MPTTTLATGTWVLSPTRTTVTVTAKNFLVRRVPAVLAVTTGRAVVGETLDDSRIEFSLAADSFSSGNARRDEHVRSADFLDAENHPSIDFRSEHIAATAVGYRVTGTLELAGDNETIAFDIDKIEAGGDGTLTFHAAAAIDRRQIGIDKMPALVIGNTIDVAVTGAADDSAR
jgi:polyisoprenoid-binding protein YceI